MSHRVTGGFLAGAETVFADGLNCLIGGRGAGKSYLCVFLLQNAQKYSPLTFIFDIGSSFQSPTTIFGGSYLNVGQESRDFTINPFSLPQSKENLQFLFSFFRVLIEGNGQRYRLVLETYPEAPALKQATASSPFEQLLNTRTLESGTNLLIADIPSKLAPFGIAIPRTIKSYL